MALASVQKVVLGCIAFVVFWFMAVFPKVPFLPVGRTAGSLLGATLMVVFQVIRPSQAFAAVDLSILGLLFGTMVVSVYLERADLFKYLGSVLSYKSRGGKDLLCRVSLLAGISSALFTNDTTCIIFTEFVLKICRQKNYPPEPFLIALATSANIGSAGTPIGNPQNLVIAVDSGISFGKFFIGIIPAVVVGILVNIAGLLMLYWRQLPGSSGREEMKDESHSLHKHHSGVFSSPAIFPSERRALPSSFGTIGNPGSEPHAQYQDVGDVRGSEHDLSGPGMNSQQSNGKDSPPECLVSIKCEEPALEASRQELGRSYHRRGKSEGDIVDMPVEYWRSSISGMDELLHLEPAVSSSGQTHLGLRLPEVCLNAANFSRSTSITHQSHIRGDEGFKKKLRRRLGKTSVYIVTLGMLVALLCGLNLSWSAMTAAVVLIVLDFDDAAPSLNQVSYSLLVFFSGMFIAVEGFNKTGIPGEFWNKVEPHCHMDSATGVILLSVVVILLSNVVSNVPTVLLLGTRVAMSAGATPGVSVTKAWLLLAWVSTVAGNLTLAGSAANLIVSEQARRTQTSPYNLSFWKHLRFGFPATLVVVAVGLPLILS